MTKERFQAKVILTIGISNCGKSTWAKEFIRNNPMFTEINRDDMRIALFCDGDRLKYNKYKFSNEREKLITKLNAERADHAISQGQGVVISDTNLNGKTRAFWKKFAEEKGVPYEEQIFDVPLHICIGRNRNRDITLPERVLRQQYDSFRKFMGLPSYTPDTDKPAAVICDLDGTLYHNTNRKVFDYDAVGTDTLDDAVAGILTGLRMTYGTKIIFFTGREDIGKCREETLKKLDEDGFEYEVFDMRAFEDHRPDVVVKEEMFWKVADDYNIVMAIDDRDQVVDLWRGLGIKCLQVDYGAF